MCFVASFQTWTQIWLCQSFPIMGIYALCDAQSMSLKCWDLFLDSTSICVPLNCLIAPCLVCPVAQMKDVTILEQAGYSGPRISWSYSCSWEEPVNAAESTQRPCPANPTGDVQQPFLAPPCHWEDFCPGLGGKDTRHSCRMERLIFSEGITQISKSYRPWNKLLFLAFFMSCWSILACEKRIPKAAVVKFLNPLNYYLTFFCPSPKLLTLVMAVVPFMINGDESHFRAHHPFLSECLRVSSLAKHLHCRCWCLVMKTFCSTSFYPSYD